eukprot:Ihof_evm12s87 gene=Ihof_evmTU12s87
MGWNRVALCAFLPLVAMGQLIKVDVQTRWDHTPVLFEASEFVAKISNSLFWDFVDSLKDHPADTTDKAEYLTAIKHLTPLVKPTLLPFFNLSISLREFSPAVQFSFQVAQEAVHDMQANPASAQCVDSEAFVIMPGGPAVCSPDLLLTSLGQQDTARDEVIGEEVLQEFDHVRGPYVANSSVPVLYGSMVNPSFHRLLSTLEAHRSTDPNFSYGMRHYTRDADRSKRSMRVAGYGVELAVKNMEYKAVDDRKFANGSGNATSVEPEDDNKDWDSEEDSYMKIEEQSELTYLKDKELSPIGLQASAMIMESGDKALDTLQEISQYFPSRARKISQTQVTLKSTEARFNNKKLKEEMLLAEGEDSLLLVNGVQHQASTVTPF